MTREEHLHATTFNLKDKFSINERKFICLNLGYYYCMVKKTKAQGWYIKSLGDNGLTYFYSFEALYDKVRKYKNENTHLIF